MNFSLIFLYIIIKICACDPDAINRIREHVIKWADSNPGAVHQVDLDRVKNQDAFIGNYLRYHKNKEIAAQKALIATLQYFKTQDFHDISDDYFASEFYATGALYVGGEGVRNESVLTNIERCNLPVAANGQKIYQHFIKFCVYKHFKMIRGDDRGHIIHRMFKGAAPLNVDIPLVRDIAPILIAHIFVHPVLYVVSDPSILVEPLIRLTMTILQIKNVYYIKQTNLAQYESLETVPVQFGGSLTGHNRMPAGAKSGRCLQHLNTIPVQQWNSFVNQNKKCINEGMKESGIASMEEYLRYC